MTPPPLTRPAPPVLARHVISIFPGSLTRRPLLSSMAIGRAGLHSQTGTIREELSQGARNSAGISRRSNSKTNKQQFSRLHLVAGNARYVLLGRDRPRNLASRVLALSLRRLSADMEKVHGYPVYLAETFVDISRFAGTCYRASNWQSLGLTRGFARRPGAAPHWHHHGQAKEVFVIPLHADARQMLCADTAPHAMNGSEDAPLPDAQLLGSLHDHLAGMADFRRARGQRYSLAFYFTIMIAARLCGYRGYTAFAEFARRLDQEQLAAIGAFRSPSRGRYTTPVATSFLNILCGMPPDCLDAVFRV